MKITTFKIKSFDPLKIEVPPVQEVEGKVEIVLPPIHVKLLDLSMGGIIEGAHVGGDIETLVYSIDFPELVEVGKIVSFIIGALPSLKEMHKIYQDGFDKEYLLDRKKK